MNETVSTLLRSALKVGAGVAVTKGVTDDATAEIVIGGIIGLVGIIWGIVAKKKPATPA